MKAHLGGMTVSLDDAIEEKNKYEKKNVIAIFWGEHTVEVKNKKKNVKYLNIRKLMNVTKYIFQS